MMIRTGLLVAAFLTTVGHAEIAEITMTGYGVAIHEANDTNSEEWIQMEGSDIVNRQWIGDGPRDVRTEYTYKFYADTENFVSDGMGGYTTQILGATYSYDGGVEQQIDSGIILSVSASGVVSFQGVQDSMNQFCISVIEGLGTDIFSEFDMRTLLEEYQGYSSGMSSPIFDYEGESVHYSVSSMDMSSRFVSEVPQLPAPGACLVLGLGGLIATRRKR
tara:strand:+ start:4540 stop:5196 length:657 start_codon:yes stop_codon:yes gene_type:complete